MARHAGVTLVAAAAGAFLGAGPALADVTVSPPSAVQGSGENLIFHVTNTGTQPMSSVTLKLPADTPVAEVYPLSVPQWAPKIAMRTLASPLPTIHGDTTTTQTAGAITWIAMPGQALAPGRTADLGVAIGPLPDLSSMPFTVSATYAGGKPGPAMPPVTLTLTPAAPGAAAQTHAGHGGAAATADPAAADGSSDAENAAFAAVVAQAERGTPVWSIAGWVVAGLALLAGLWLVLRGRHRAEEEDEPEDDEANSWVAEADETDESEPVGAGSKWSFKG